MHCQHMTPTLRRTFEGAGRMWCVEYGRLLPLLAVFVLPHLDLDYGNESSKHPKVASQNVRATLIFLSWIKQARGRKYCSLEPDWTLIFLLSDLMAGAMSALAAS